MDLDLELVAEGFQFPEGPIAMADGSVVLVEIERKTLTRVAPDGTTSIIAVCPMMMRISDERDVRPISDSR